MQSYCKMDSLSHASGCLTEKEQQYSNIERELLGVVFALKRLNHYTYRFTTKVQSDHEPLMSISKKTIAAASLRVQRLLLRLSKYDVEIEYLQGKENVIADALSRVNPLPPTQQDYELQIIPVHTVSKTVPATATRLQEPRHSTQNDSILTKLKHAVHTG